MERSVDPHRGHHLAVMVMVVMMMMMVMREILRPLDRRSGLGAREHEAEQNGENR